MNREKEMLMAADVLSYLKSNGKCSKMSLYREFYQTMSFKTFTSIMESLQNTGLLKTQGGIKGITFSFAKAKQPEKEDGTNATSV